MVIPRRASGYAIVLLLVLALSVFAHRVIGLDRAHYSRVKWVIDGDTILLEDGRKVRYAGIDTPERHEPFYRKATRRNIELVKGKVVRLVICKQKPRDRFGRTLAWVYVWMVWMWVRCC